MVTYVPASSEKTKFEKKKMNTKKEVESCTICECYRFYFLIIVSPSSIRIRSQTKYFLGIWTRSTTDKMQVLSRNY